jgi:hypothetical protein
MGSGLSREKHSSLPYSFLSDLLLTLVALELDADSLGRGENAGIFAAVVTTIYSHVYWRASAGVVPSRPQSELGGSFSA